MNLTAKMKYEISLWEDRQNSNGQIEEAKILILGSNELKSQANIFEPVFTKKLDGPNSLSFSIFAKYQDEETQELINNPIVQHLHNESKIKLKYYPTEQSSPEWYDFIIKKVDESSDNYKITYTATDFYINELAKNGYNLVFDTETENNLGTVKYLAEQILEDTDWEVEIIGDKDGSGEITDKIIDYKEEALFWLTGSSDSTNVKNFVFYSSTTGKHPYKGYQFLQVNGNIEEANGIITNGKIIFSTDANIPPIFSTFNHENKTGYTISNYRALAEVYSPKIIYDKRLDKYVEACQVQGKSETYAKYTETEYKSVENVINFITNGYSITTDSGWLDTKFNNLQIKALPEITRGNWNQEKTFGFKIPISDGSCCLFNSGFTDNLKRILPITINKTYCARFEFCDKNGDSYTPKSLRFEFKKYKTDENGITPLGNSFLEFEKINEEIKQLGGYWINGKFSDNYSLEFIEESIENRGFFLTITDNSDRDIFLVTAEFFEKVETEDENDQKVIILPTKEGLKEDGTFSKNIDNLSEVNTTFYYYDFDQPGTTKSSIQYEYIGKENSKYVPVYSNEKRRSISAKESNRFNLLQTIAEQFEVWCVTDISHNDHGNVTQKKIKFIKSIGKHKEVPTIKYGLNLKSIKRTLDSDKIATKLIVKNNSNEFATNNSCSIARASLNPTGENFLLNLDYFINRKRILQNSLNNDLYTNLLRGSDLGTEVTDFIIQGPVGLYNGLKSLNAIRDKKIIEQSALIKNLSTYESSYQAALVYKEKVFEALADLKIKLNKETGFTYEQFTDGNEGTKKYLDQSKILAMLEDIKIRTGELNTYTAEAEKCKKVINGTESGALVTTKAKIESLDTELKNIEEATKKIIKTFEDKYKPFIQEASWTSNDYIDDQLYYIDSEAVLRGSAFPKISYTIDALDLGYCPGFEYFHYDLADVVMVEDTENFGWAPATGEPFKEKFIITEQKINFDSPEKNSITTKNYHTSFQDLFQRFAAATQQLQFSEGDWNKASKVVEGTQITSQSLQEAFGDNKNTLVNSKNKTLEFGEKGLVMQNAIIPAEVVRVTGSGIFLTKDGGQNWTTGITATGINANSITTGELDTSKITIKSGKQPAFYWDEKGLNAYASEFKNGTFSNFSPNNFVRFDQYGIYKVSDKSGFSQDTFDKKAYGDKDGYIQDNSLFSLTQSGVTIGQKGAQDHPKGYLYFNTKNGGTFELCANDIKLIVSKEDNSKEVKSILKATEEQIELQVKNIEDNAKKYTDSQITVTNQRIAQSVTEANVDWSGSENYDIAIYAKGVPQNNSLYPAKYYKDKHYLNTDNGKLYKSNGSSWEDIGKELNKTTDILGTQIEQTAKSITSAVYGVDEKALGYSIDLFGNKPPQPNTAEENKDQYYLDYENGWIYKSNGAIWVVQNTTPVMTPYSKIEQTKDSITSTVASATDDYVLPDISDRLIKDYGEPDSNVYEVTKYQDYWYLDIISGQLYWNSYKPDNTSGGWNKSTKYPDPLVRKDSALKSQIEQTADSITLTIAGSDTSWELPYIHGTNVIEESNTTKGYGVGTPETGKTYYLDLRTGKVYNSENITICTLPKVTSQLKSSIEQLGDSITLQVAAANTDWELPTHVQVLIYDKGDISNYTDGANAELIKKYPPDKYDYDKDYNENDNTTNKYYYLDVSTGQLYYSDGAVWRKSGSHPNPLQKKTEVLGSQIQTTKKSVIMASYGINDTELEYSIDLYGDFDLPNDTYLPGEYKDKYYLNYITGQVYRSDGEEWDKYAILETTYSQIKTSKDSIISTVSGARNLIKQSGLEYKDFVDITYSLEKTLQENKEYTLSINMENDLSKIDAVQLWLYDENDTNPVWLYTIPLTMSHRRTLKHTFTIRGIAQQILNSKTRIKVWSYKDGKSVQAQGSTIYWIQLEKGSIASSWGQTESEQTYQSQIVQLSDSIDAKVNDKQTGEGFGWELKTDGFNLYSYGADKGQPNANNIANRVFQCDNNKLIIGGFYGDNSNYIKFANGELELNVSALTITTGSGDANLLFQTAPGDFTRNQQNAAYNEFFSKWTVESSRNGVIYTGIPESGSHNGIYIAKSDGGEFRPYICQYCEKLELGKYYTISGYYIGKNLQISYTDEGQGKTWVDYKVPNQGTSSVLRYFEYTFLSQTNYRKQIKFCQHTYDSQDFCLYNLKLQKGKSGTSWTPNSSETAYSNSQIVKLPELIKAEVNKGTDGGTKFGFGWKLDADGFYLYRSKGAANPKTVFSCDEDGIVVTGTITANAGSKIGGWLIENDRLVTTTGGSGLYFDNNNSICLGNSISESLLRTYQGQVMGPFIPPTTNTIEKYRVDVFGPTELLGICSFPSDGAIRAYKDKELKEYIDIEITFIDKKDQFFNFYADFSYNLPDYEKFYIYVEQYSKIIPASAPLTIRSDNEIYLNDDSKNSLRVRLQAIEEKLGL